jgi:chemotaxis protein CheX
MPTVTSNDIYDAVHGIFQSMLGTEPRLHSAERTDESQKNAGVAAVVSYAGEHEGTVVFSCGKPLAVSLAELMLMEEGLDPDGDEVDDAMGEIANMIAGQIKNLVCRKGNEVQLSIPVILHDGDYRLQVPAGYERWLITAFHVDEQPFFVELVTSRPVA